MITFLDGIKLLIPMASIGIILGYILGLYELINTMIDRVTNHKPKIYKDKSKLYKKYLFKFSTFKKYLCYVITLSNEISEEVKEDIPIVRFKDISEANKWLILHITKYEDVLLISNSLSMSNSCRDTLMLKAQESHIPTAINCSSMEDYQKRIDGFNWDYVLWYDVCNSHYKIFRKDEQGVNIIKYLKEDEIDK